MSRWAARHKERMPRAPSYPQPWVPKSRAELVQKPKHVESWLDWVEAARRSEIANELRPMAKVPDGLKEPTDD